MTIGIIKAVDVLINSGNLELDSACKDNTIVLQEIRDNAVYFKNNDFLLTNKVQEVGTASLRNYLNLIRIWFNYDLSKYNFFLMPLSCFHEFDAAKSHSIENS